MNRPTVLVACGAGIATSTVVLDQLEELFERENIKVELVQCKIAEVASLQSNADLIVSSTILPTKYAIPAISATAYLSGIGIEELDKEVLRALRK